MRKYILFITSLLLIPVYLYAVDGFNTVNHPAKVNGVTTPDKINTVSGLAAAGADFCDGYVGILCQDWEGNDTCANLGWTVQNIVDCQATDQKQGSYSAKVTDDGSDSGITEDTGGDYATIFIKFNWRTDTVGAADHILYLLDGFTEVAQLYFLTPAYVKLRAQHGTVVDDGTTEFAIDTWYTIKVKWVTEVSGGTDGEMYLWAAAGIDQALSTATGDAEIQITTGNAEYLIDKFQLVCKLNNSNVWFDNIQVKGTDPDA